MPGGQRRPPPVSSEYSHQVTFALALLLTQLLHAAKSGAHVTYLWTGEEEGRGGHAPEDSQQARRSAPSSAPGPCFLSGTRSPELREEGDSTVSSSNHQSLLFLP